MQLDILKVRSFYCSTCGKEFHRKDHLKVHERIHSGQKRFACNFCNYSANQLSHVQQHTVYKHTRDFPHQCSCDMFHVENLYPQVHSNLIAGLYKDQNYTCRICGKVFKRPDNLRVHERIHNTQKAFKCSYCNYGFIQDLPYALMEEHSLVNNASRTVTGVKVFHCSHCSYTAKQLAHLKEHIIYIHTRNFPFTCSVCGKGFTAMHRLKNHQIIKHH